jgi:hypothetical protein
MDTSTTARPFDLGLGDAVRPNTREARVESPEAIRQRIAAKAEARQRAGKRMILAGFVIAIVGVVLYCVACFAGGASAGMDDILFRNAVPFARSMLAVLGFGTLLWLVGSFVFLRGAMDAEPDALDPTSTVDA